MSDKGEFSQTMWEARIPRYSRVIDPFREEFKLWATTVGKLDRKRPVWIITDEDSTQQKRLFGLAAKAALTHGTPVRVFAGYELGQLAARDFGLVQARFFEHMMFVAQPEALNEEENFGLINAYRYWKLMELPFWFQSRFSVKGYIAQLPTTVLDTINRSDETYRWYRNDLVKRVQVLRASDYV